MNEDELMDRLFGNDAEFSQSSKDDILFKLVDPESFNKVRDYSYKISASENLDDALFSTIQPLTIKVQDGDVDDSNI